MELWIIAAIAVAVLLASIAYLAMRKSDDTSSPESWRPRHSQPWDARADEPVGSRVASMVPPAGLPHAPVESVEVALSAFESQEIYGLDDDEPTGPVPRIIVTSAGRSHPGRKRHHNEDALLVLAEHEVYAVADGMGGYAAGEVASELAVSTLRHSFETGQYGTPATDAPRRGAELIGAIREANARIRSEALLDDRKEGMGTTIVATRFSPRRKRVYIAHVGDSRCYRLREGRLKQLTTDHTLGAVGITGPTAGKLSRAVGVFEYVEVDLTVDEPQPGDFYLLCSDGLSKMVDPDTIAAGITSEESVEDAAEQLVVMANERGGRDNVSVVLIRIDDPIPDRDRSGPHRLPV